MMSTAAAIEREQQDETVRVISFNRWRPWMGRPSSCYGMYHA